MGNNNDLTDLNFNFSLDDISRDIEEEKENDIAIIGISIKTPYGKDINEFWDRIQEGFDFIGDLPKEREKDVVRYFNYVNKGKNDKLKYFKGAYFKEIDKFDYKFFKMTPKEAELMDPYQKIFLENTLKAIEDAGYGGDRLKKTETGIFVGYGGNMKDSYQKIIFDVNPKAIPLSFVGNMNGFIGSRISYLLDLRGPSMIIDTTCASSLAAVHTACQSLINGECSMAIAGSIRINIIPLDNDVYRMGVESKDYETRSFDKYGDGFGIGEGVVSMVLKPLNRAVYDNDSIYAVIKGSSLNQGGNSMALTATNPEAQTDVIKRTWNNSHIDPETIELIEAHGTATNLGDPVEIKGLTDAFREYTNKKSFCAIGSVKSNLGHLYEASGIVGLVKIIMAVRNKVIPASLNLNNPNDEIDFVNSPLYVNTKSKVWDTSYKKRRAAINSFGLNGANCHMVIEEYSEDDYEDDDINSTLNLAVSAKSVTALSNLLIEYKKYIENNEVNLKNVCYTAAVGRWHYNYRLIITFNNREELIDRLTEGISSLSTGIKNTSYLQYSILPKNFEELQLEEDVSSYSQEDINEKYLKGYKIPWYKLYSDLDYKILHIPSYEFDKFRCWIDIPEVSSEEFAYDMKWIEKEYEDKVKIDKKVTLLVSSSLTALESYEEELKVKGIECYKALGQDLDYIISIVEDKNIKRVIYIADNEIFRNVDSVDDFNYSLQEGFYTLFNLYRSLKAEELVLITRNLNYITGEEEYIAKELSPAAALMKIIEKEDKNIKLKTIDADLNTEVSHICNEIFREDNNYITLRKDKRYIQVFSKINVKNDTDIDLKKDGCYLVTGGTGSIALELCKSLSKKEKITFVLVNRSRFLERNLWEEALEENKDEKIIRKIKGIKEIEANGCKVILKCADIGNFNEVRNLINHIENSIGSINGVIHCAGVSDSALIKDTSVEEIDKVLNPKAKGIFNIEKALNHNLQFYILLSSVATFFPSSMQLAYCAANTYLDGFTDYLMRKGQKVLRINWTTWKEIGMAKEAGIADDFAFKALKTKEAVSYFEKILKDSSISKALLGNINRTKMGISIIKKSGVIFDDNVNLKINDDINEENIRVYENSKEVKITGKADENYTKVEKEIAKICKEILGYNVINVYENFFEMGADSLQIMNIQKKISEIYPDKIDSTDMFSYSNVAKLAQFISSKLTYDEIKEKEIIVDDSSSMDEEFAIIGIAAKLPETDSLQDFHNFIVSKQCAVSDLPKWRKKFLQDYLRFKHLPLKDYKFSPGSYLKDVDKFDYKYFNISPREAALTDPHQRLFLEVVHEAIEDAGYGGNKVSNSKTGVFLGFASNIRDMYSRIIYEVNDKTSGDAIVGNTQAVAAGRISYHLNLKGASMVIDTACSSSITAIDTAINFLKSGSISMAVIGGIKLNLVPMYTEEDENGIGMESSDGITRSFDATSDGTAFGEGVEAIVIKPLSKAIEDGDHIYASIKGVAINQDGNTSGITAPNPQSQKEVILEAWKKANINPEDLSYIESHGTGTQLGDRIEFRSLTEAFREYTNKKSFCALGAVKTNIGHLSEGSGLAGLLKGIMALKNEVIPPSINFINPNKEIKMIDSPLYINTKPISWPVKDKPRMFALSNFGMSGTNAHIVLQEYKDERENIKSETKQIITISNKTYEGFMESISEFIHYSEVNPEVNLESLAYTINTGRGHYDYRLALIVEDVKELRYKLLEFKNKEISSDGIYYGRNKIIFDKRENKKDYELYEDDKRILNEKAYKALEEDKDLDYICKLYTMGADVDWTRLYEGRKIIKVSAPTYKFARTSSWIDIPKIECFEEDEIFYNTKWIPVENKNYSIEKNKVYLIFYNENDDYSKEFIEKICVDNVVIKINTEYMRRELNSVEAYIKLLRKYKEDNISHIVNMVNLGLNKEYEEKLGLYSLFYLTKAMAEVNYSSKITSTVITNEVWEVSGKGELLNPAISSAIGLNRVIGLEMVNVTAKAIDIDKFTSVENVIAELSKENDKYLVSFRKNIRYEEEFIQDAVEEGNEYVVKDSGVYVLTGGTGGIALVLARALAERNNKVKIALLNRSELIDDGSAFKKNKINNIEKIRELGAEVTVYKVDVTDEVKVKETFDELKKSYGRINGVIHTAGVASAEILVTKSVDNFKEVVDPKIKGTINLFKEIKDDNVDFFVLCGSSSVLTGEASQADYVAANTFLNAFTYYANKLGVNTKCINWVSWKTEGMAVRYNINVDTIFKALENEDAIKGFFNIINSKLKRAFIGKLNVDYFNDTKINVDSLPFNVEAKLKKVIGNSNNAVDLEFNPMKTRRSQAIDESDMKLLGKETSSESYSDIEKEVAAIFMKVLGYNTIDIYDSFFELGGDSILLGRVHASLEEKYPGKFKLVDLFEYTSVFKIAQFIAEGDKKIENDDVEEEEDLDFESMLKDLETGELSVDDMIKKLD